MPNNPPLSYDTSVKSKNLSLFILDNIKDWNKLNELNLDESVLDTIEDFNKVYYRIDFHDKTPKIRNNVIPQHIRSRWHLRSEYADINCYCHARQDMPRYHNNQVGHFATNDEMQHDFFVGYQLNSCGIGKTPNFDLKGYNHNYMHYKFIQRGNTGLTMNDEMDITAELVKDPNKTLYEFTLDDKWETPEDRIKIEYLGYYQNKYGWRTHYVDIYDDEIDYDVQFSESVKTRSNGIMDVLQGYWFPRTDQDDYNDFDICQSKLVPDQNGDLDLYNHAGTNNQPLYADQYNDKLIFYDNTLTDKRLNQFDMLMGDDLSRIDRYLEALDYTPNMHLDTNFRWVLGDIGWSGDEFYTITIIHNGILVAENGYEFTYFDEYNLPYEYGTINNFTHKYVDNKKYDNRYQIQFKVRGGCTPYLMFHRKDNKKNITEFVVNGHPISLKNKVLNTDLTMDLEIKSIATDLFPVNNSKYAQIITLENISRNIVIEMKITDGLITYKYLK